MSAACGSPSGATTTRLSIATGGTGGVFYPYGGGIARVISEHLPNVEATAEVTAASVDNLKFLQRGTSDLAFTMADTAQDAVLGRDAFAASGKVGVRTLATLYTSYVHFVTTADSGITRIADLRGRVVSTGAAGSGTAILANRILQAAGLDPARDIRAQSLGVAQSVDALKDGKVDAFFWNGGLPTASILDLINTPGVTARVLSTADVLPQLQQTFGASLYFAAPIPKDTYDQESDAQVDRGRQSARRLGHDERAARLRHHAAALRAADDARRHPPGSPTAVARDGGRELSRAVPPWSDPLLPRARSLEAVRRAG